jgi:hypothetical protein
MRTCVEDDERRKRKDEQGTEQGKSKNHDYPRQKKILQKGSLFALGLGHSLGGGEAQGVVISFEFKA